MSADKQQSFNAFHEGWKAGHETGTAEGYRAGLEQAAQECDDGTEAGARYAKLIRALAEKRG
jgi:hypothetical protein